MQKNDRNQILCQSHFKNGDVTDKRQYTQIWIQLINRLEKSKCIK